MTDYSDYNYGGSSGSKNGPPETHLTASSKPRFRPPAKGQPPPHPEEPKMEARAVRGAGLNGQLSTTAALVSKVAETAHQAGLALEECHRQLQQLQVAHDAEVAKLADAVNQPMVARLWGSRGRFEHLWNTTMAVDAQKELGMALEDFLQELSPMIQAQAPAATADAAMNAALLELQPVCMWDSANEQHEHPTIFCKMVHRHPLAPKEERVLESLMRSRLLGILQDEVWSRMFHGLPQLVHWNTLDPELVQQLDLQKLLQQGPPRAGDAPAAAATEWVDLVLKFYRDQARQVCKRYDSILQEQKQHQQAPSGHQTSTPLGTHNASTAYSVTGSSASGYELQGIGSPVMQALVAWQQRVADRLLAQVAFPPASASTTTAQLVDVEGDSWKENTTVGDATGQHARLDQAATTPGGDPLQATPALAPSRRAEYQQLLPLAMAVVGQAIKLQFLTTAVHPELVVRLVPVGSARQDVVQQVEVEKHVQVTPNAWWSPWTVAHNRRVDHGHVLANLLPAVMFANGSQVVARGRVHMTAPYALHDQRGAWVLE